MILGRSGSAIRLPSLALFLSPLTSSLLFDRSAKSQDRPEMALATRCAGPAENARSPGR